MPLSIPIEVLPHAVGPSLPGYATPGAAGMDLVAAIPAPLEIPPGRRALVPTGLRLAIPSGFEGQVRARSGFAWKHGLVVPNAPGTIDSDYRGELQVILMNLGEAPVRIDPGMRIAQLVVAAVAHVTWVRVHALPETARGEGGFGHTGRST